MIDPERLEDLVAQCIERIETDGLEAVDAVCAHHPEYADAIRADVEAAVRMGLTGPVTSAFETPTRVGPFILMESIGRGGMGVVHRARDTTLDRDVAVKLLRPEFTLFDGAMTRFRREADAIARLDHPGIVRIHGAGIEGGVPWFAMEHIEGANLADIISRRRSSGLDASMPARQGLDGYASLFRSLGHVSTESITWEHAVVEFVRQAAEALDHAHERGVLHRDVKPSNLMLTHQGRVVLLDFGLARRDRSSRLTLSNAQPGSLPYMAPEQLRSDARRIDRRTDVYGLGVAFYELLTRRRPFLDEDAETLRAHILDGSAPPPRQVDASISWDAESVCLKAMDPEPEHRYASAAAMARDLVNVLDGRPITARRAGILRRGRRFVRRHPARAVAIVLAVVLFLVVPAGIAWRESTARRLAERQKEKIRRARDAARAAEREALAEAARAGGAERFLEYLLDNSSGWIWLRDARRSQDVMREARAALRPLALHDARRGRLARSIARNLQLLGLGSEAIEIAGQSVEAFDAADLPIDAADARLDRADYRVHGAVDLGEARADLETALGVFGPRDDFFRTARAHFKLAQIARLEAGTYDANHLAAAADDLDAAKDTPLPDWYALAIETTFALIDLRTIDEARHLLDVVGKRVDDENRTSGSARPASLAVARAELLFATDHATEAKELVEKTIQRLVNDRSRSGALSGLTKGRVGSRLFRWGRRDDAETLLRDAVAETAGWETHRSERARFSCNLASLLSSKGRHGEALRFSREAVRLRSDAHGPTPQAAHCLHGEGRSLVALGRAKEAVEVLEQAAGLYEAAGAGNKVLGFCARDLGEAYRRDGRRPLAVQAYRRAERALDEVKEKTAREALVGVCAQIGRMTMAEGEGEDAVAAFEKARRLVVSLRGENASATCRVSIELGGALTGLGRFDEAETLLLWTQQTLSAKGPAATRDLDRAKAALVKLYTAWKKPDQAARWR